MQKTAFSAEILAPAGSREQLEAAVKSGADAVYFGASDFNARRNAENFTDEQFLQAVRYCRVRGVKAYITLNTLFTDAETERFLKTAALVAQSGADGVIVQDLGAAALHFEHRDDAAYAADLVKVAFRGRLDCYVLLRHEHNLLVAFESRVDGS